MTGTYLGMGGIRNDRCPNYVVAFVASWRMELEGSVYSSHHLVPHHPVPLLAGIWSGRGNRCLHYDLQAARGIQRCSSLLHQAEPSVRVNFSLICLWSGRPFFCINSMQQGSVSNVRRLHLLDLHGVPLCSNKILMYDGGN